MNWPGVTNGGLPVGGGTGVPTGLEGGAVKLGAVDGGDVKTVDLGPWAASPPLVAVPHPRTKATPDSATTRDRLGLVIMPV